MKILIILLMLIEVVSAKEKPVPIKNYVGEIKNAEPLFAMICPVIFDKNEINDYRELSINGYGELSKDKCSSILDSLTKAVKIDTPKNLAMFKLIILTKKVHRLGRYEIVLFINEKGIYFQEYSKDGIQFMQIKADQSKVIRSNFHIETNSSISYNRGDKKRISPFEKDLLK